MRSLRVRLLAILVVAVAVALGTVALAARGAVSRELDRLVARNQYELRSAADQLVEQRGGRIVFASEDGRVVADTAGEFVGRQVDRQVIEHLTIVASRGTPITATRVGAVARAELIPGEPLMPLREDVLFVRMAPPPGAAGVPGEQIFLDSVNSSLLAAVVVGGIAAVVLTLFFSRRVLGPVDALTAAARRMEGGDLRQRVDVRGDDEIGELARAFNAMAASVERTERLRRMMVSDVAHELRTPLSNVRGYLEALRDGVASPTPAMIDSLHEEALLLTRLVNDLQELTLAEAGQLRLAREAVPVDDLIDAALQAVAPRATDAGVRLRAEVAPGLLPVMADQTRVGQVLRNLLDNALTHTPPDGEIVVTGAVVGESVEVAVRDSGCGIAAEHLPHVFERFYRADHARARATGGTGIGLAIVRELVQAHGGFVDIESTLGAGTTVRFTLPSAAPSAPEPSRQLALVGR